MVYDESIPASPPSNLQQSPQFLSKSSLSSTSSCATAASSTPRESAPTTPWEALAAPSSAAATATHIGVPALEEEDRSDREDRDAADEFQPAIDTIEPTTEPSPTEPTIPRPETEPEPDLESREDESRALAPVPINTEVMAEATPSPAAAAGEPATPRFGAFLDFLREPAAEEQRQRDASLGGMESTSIEVLDEAPAEEGLAEGDGGQGEAEGDTEEGGVVLSECLTMAVEAEAAAAARRSGSDLGTASDFPGVALPPRSDATPTPCSPHDHATDYANRYPAMMPDYTKALDTKHRIGRRCYRLNLERPFDIHCEQSPLEYGDYMAPWKKEVYPDTVGPTEYCPPRHLGGEPGCWRELMRWSDAAAGRAAHDAEVAGVEVHDERKVNSLDEVEAGISEIELQKREGGTQSLASGVLSPGLTVHLDEEKRGSADEIEPAVDRYGKAVGPGPTGGWRKLSPAEVSGVQHLGDRNDRGEFTFRNYDLSHVALNTAHKSSPAKGEQDVAKESGEAPAPLRTVFSMDSTTSEDERNNPKTPEQMADDTARLFRRSELSLREKAEREEAEKEEQRRKDELERLEKERAKRQDGLSMSTREPSRRRSGSAGADPLSQSEGVLRKGQRRRFSSGGKKLLRGLSSGLSRAISDMSGTPSSDAGNWRGASHRRSGSESSRRAGMQKRSSMQALTIDKARDLVDESDDESIGGSDKEEGEETDKKPLNVSLFILGEHDTLNDLVNDGAKRLRDNRESSDLNLLLQNEPCPPPDRWVRTTGWSRCNPSSLYAALPPEDFDWERYYDKLRLKTGKMPPKDGAGGPSGAPQDKVEGQKDSTTTQTTASTVAVSASVSGEHQPPPPPPSGKASKAPTLSPISSPAVTQVKTAPTDKSTPKATPKAVSGAKSHFNAQADADRLAQSARAPRSKSGSSAKGNSDSLSQSEGKAKPKGGFGRMMSKKLKGK